jgi:uncharacterized SAM-binding protein YcdF (DUF218 family)
MKGPDHSSAPTSVSAAVGDRARRRGRRWLRVAGLSVLTISLIATAFLGGFAAFSTHVSRLTTPDVPEDADAIIVLTGGHQRIDAAVDLLKSGKGERLLISGVNPMARAVDLQVATGGDAHLFACCVDIDRAALDTIGNAEESAKWINAHAYGKVIVVTNNYHMPRSLLELQRMIDATELLPYPVVNTRLDGGAWLTNADALRVLFMEYTKYLAAIARGALPADPPAAERPQVIEASSVGVDASN